MHAEHGTGDRVSGLWKELRSVMAVMSQATKSQRWEAFRSRSWRYLREQRDFKT